jgi:hypothetical protein
MMTDLKTKKIGDLFKSRIDAFKGDWDEYCEKYDILNPEHKDFHSNLPEHWNTLKSKVLVEVSVARKGSSNNYWEYYLIPEDLCEKALMLGEFPHE